MVNFKFDMSYSIKQLSSIYDCTLTNIPDIHTLHTYIHFIVLHVHTYLKIHIYINMYSSVTMCRTNVDRITHENIVWKRNRPDDIKRERRNNHLITTHSRHQLARPTETSEGMRCPDGWLPPLNSIPPLRVTHPH